MTITAIITLRLRPPELQQILSPTKQNKTEQKQQQQQQNRWAKNSVQIGGYKDFLTQFQF